MPGGEIHLLGVLRGAQKFDVQQSPEVLVEFFTRTYHPPSLMSTLQKCSLGSRCSKIFENPAWGSSSALEGCSGSENPPEVRVGADSGANDPERLPCTKIIPRDPVTIQEPGIVLEFFWRRWNFIFSGSYSVPYKYERDS